MKRIISIVTSVVTFLIVMIAILLVGVRLVGLQPYTILSGSMRPNYDVGSLIYIRETDPKTIAVGDPITYVLNEDLVVATHRVVAVDGVNETFVTKGDANTHNDAQPVHFKNVLGVPQFVIPYLGYVAQFVMSLQGLIVIGVIVGVLVLISIGEGIYHRKTRVVKAETGKDVH